MHKYIRAIKQIYLNTLKNSLKVLTNYFSEISFIYKTKVAALHLENKYEIII